MDAVVIVTILALLQYVYFGFQVGGMRGKTGIKAPAMTGDDRFERMNRVHQNTLEQLIMLLPAMWLFAQYVNPVWAAAMGAVYLFGRFVYRISYVKDPAKRSIGFVMSLLPGMIMLFWVLAAMLKNMM